MKTKIQSLIRSLAAALFAIAASFAASAEVVEGHPTWTLSGTTLTSSDGWCIPSVNYSSGVMTFTFRGKSMLTRGSGFTTTTLDFTNLKYAEGGADLSGVYAFGNNAFAGTDGYKKETLVTKIILPEYITALGNMTFWYFTALTDVEGLENVTDIGQYVFYADANLSTLTGNPDLSKLDRIGYEAFGGSGLTAINLSGSSMTAMPDRLFAGCTALRFVTLPQQLVSLGANTFLGCSSLVAIDLPATLAEMGESCFEGTTSLDSTVTSAGLPRIPERAFANSGVRNFVAGAALEEVGPEAFCNATGLTELNLSAATKLAAVRDRAFYGCSSLTTVTPLLPDTLTTFGASAFEGCSVVTGTLALKGSGYAFGSRAFWGWDSLQVLVLGEHVLDLPADTFGRAAGGTPALQSVTFEATEMRELTKGIFPGQTGVTTLTLHAAHLRTPGLAFEDLTGLKTVNWKGAVPYGLTADPFPNVPNGQITVYVSGASWSRKTTENDAVAPLLIDNLSTGKPQSGRWIFEGTKASPTRYQNTSNDDPLTVEGTYSVPIGDGDESVKVDAEWLTNKGQTPSDKTATENWLKGGAGDYKNWMAYVLGNEPGDKVVITSDAAKDTDTGVTIKLGNVADFRDVQTGKTGRPKADECYVSTKFQLMKLDYQKGEYVAEGTPSESTEFTLPFDACTPAARYTVRIAFTADSKTLFVDAVDTIVVYNGAAQSFVAPGVDPGAEVTLTYATEQGGDYSPTLPSRMDVGTDTVYVKANKSGYAEATATAKLTILQADNSWTDGPSIEPDSWQDAADVPGYDLVARPQFGSDTVEASIDGGAWMPFSGFSLDTTKGIHTIEFNVPETPNYRELTGSLTYSVGTYYTAHEDQLVGWVGEKSYVEGHWTIDRDGPDTGPKVKVVPGYDYAVLPGGKIRTEADMKSAENPFNGDTLILLGDGSTKSTDAPALWLKGANEQPGDQHYIRIAHLVVSGAGMLSNEDQNKYFHVGPLKGGGFGHIEFKPGATLFLGGQGSGQRYTYLESKITGDASASIRLSDKYTSTASADVTVHFYFDGDMSEFLGRIASENQTVGAYVNIYLNNTFGGSIGRLFTNRDTHGRLHLAPAAVGEQGIPVESGDALAPGSLVLDGDWSESAVGANQRVLVYPAGTTLDVADFTNIAPSLNPALVTQGDGSVVLVVNYNMAALAINAESPAAVTYDGKEHGLAVCPTVSPEEAHATLAYSTDDGTSWTEFDELGDLPTFKDAGSHEIKLKAEADGYQSAFASVFVRINKATGVWSIDPSISEPHAWDDGSAPASVTVSFGKANFDAPVIATLDGASYSSYVVGDDTRLGEAVRTLSPGTHTVTFTATDPTGNYTSPVAKQVEITVTPSFTITIETDWSDFTYDGTTHTLSEPTVRKDGKVVTQPSLEYQVGGGAWSASLPQLKNAGTYTINIKAVVDGATEQVEKNVTVRQKEITSATAASQTYTGSKLTPVLTVKADELDATYTVSAWNPAGLTDAGDYTATVTGTGNFTGSKSVTFTIETAGPIPVTINGGIYYELVSGDDVKTVFIFTDTAEGQYFRTEQDCTADILVVGGGGGQVVSASAQSLVAGTSYAITVGAGGAGGWWTDDSHRSTQEGQGGLPSSFGETITALGGKGHVGDPTKIYSSGGASGNGKSGGLASGNSAAGGGGGQTESGKNGNDTNKPACGGEGETSDITGVAQVYGSGGGGGVSQFAAADAGKGGTNAGGCNRGTADAAPTGFGGGGGGGGPINGASSSNGCAGGSGTVIISVKGKCKVTDTRAPTT